MKRAMSKPSANQTRSFSPAEPSNPSKVSRRRFGKDLAIATAFSFSRVAPFSSPPSPYQLTNAEKQGGDAAGGSAQNAEVEAKLANVIRKYGSRLSKEERAHLHKILDRSEKMLASVRAFSVQNGDSPANVFKSSISSKGRTPKPLRSSPGQASR